MAEPTPRAGGAAATAQSDPLATAPGGHGTAAPQGPGEPPQSAQPSRAAVRLLTAVVVLVCLGTGGWVAMRRAAQATALAAERARRVAAKAEGVPLVVATASLGPSKRIVRLPGEVRAKQVTKLYAKVPGYLRTMLVDKGDRVQAGQILGVIESPETDQQLIDAKSNLLLKDQLVARLIGLVGGGVVSKQEMDEAAAQRRSAKAGVARIAALQDYTNLRAPFAGIITARYVDAGALLPAATASTGSAQPLVELQDHGRVRIWLYLGQADAPFVQVGAPVTIAARDAALAPFAATVTRTSHALEARSRTMLVEVEVDNEAGRLTPGLFVDVTLALSLPPHIEVPSDALLSRGGQAMLAVVADRRVKLVPVEVGRDDGRHVAIYSGVAAGDMVGLHVPDDVEQGARIKPLEGKPVTRVPDAAR